MPTSIEFESKPSFQCNLQIDLIIDPPFSLSFFKFIHTMKRYTSSSSLKILLTDPKQVIKFTFSIFLETLLNNFFKNTQGHQCLALIEKGSNQNKIIKFIPPSPEFSVLLHLEKCLSLSKLKSIPQRY